METKKQSSLGGTQDQNDDSRASAAQIPAKIPLITPYKMGKFDLSHRYYSCS